MSTDKTNGSNEPITKAPAPGSMQPQGDQLLSEANANNWMTTPQHIPNCPPGLECLFQLDQLIVRQEIDIRNAMFNYQNNYEFSIFNSNGQYVYKAIEDNDCCTRNCLQHRRPFDMQVLDVNQYEIIHFYRPFRCFPCCFHEIKVSANGEIFGSVKQEWSLCFPNYRILNHLDEVVLRIEGPFCTLACCNDVHFKIVSLDGTEVGKITKEWSGLFREMFTNADYFGITFPVDLDVRMKAVMLGACMLINCMYYERDQNNRNH